MRAILTPRLSCTAQRERLQELGNRYVGLGCVPAKDGARSCGLPRFDQPLSLRNLIESFALLDFQPQWNVLGERGARISHRCSLSIEVLRSFVSESQNAHLR